MEFFSATATAIIQWEKREINWNNNIVKVALAFATPIKCLI